MALTRHNITDPQTQPLATEIIAPALYRVAWKEKDAPIQYTEVEAESTTAALATIGEPRPMWAFTALKQHYRAL